MLVTLLSRARAVKFSTQRHIERFKQQEQKLNLFRLCRVAQND